MALVDSELHIPQGIRFECTGCGNCCLAWPVPLTESDAQRMEGYVPAAVGAAASTGTLIRRLPSSDTRFQGFTHTLEKRADGHCTFLTEDNRCALHVEHGSEAKPSMCRLFPYAFNETPDGVFAYVSFASTGVLFNCGRLLCEQQELLQEQHRLYRQLFLHARADWSQLQWLDGAPLSWRDYREFEESLLAELTATDDRSALERLSQCSKLVMARLPAGCDAEKFPPLESRPKIVDQLLLAHLDRFYLPRDLFNNSSFDLDTRSLMTDLIAAPAVVTMSGEREAVRFQTLIACKLGRLPEDAEQLLNRFVYSRVFAKLYFGPGLGHLSLLVGIHHLYFLLALLRLRLKQIKIENGEVGFEDVADLLRALERRLTQVSLSRQTNAALEVLLASPARLERVAYLVQ